MKRDGVVVAGLVALLVVGCSSEQSNAQLPSAAVESSPSQAVSPAPAGKLTTVTVASNGAGSIEMALPVNSNNQRVAFSDLRNVRGHWEQTFGGERIRTLDPDAGFTVDIISDAPELPFLQNVDGAEVSVTYDGKSRVISLKGDNYDWRTEKLD